MTARTNKESAVHRATQVVKHFEGFYAKAYWDYGQWSVGYGTKAKNRNEVIGKAEAENRLQKEIGQVARACRQLGDSQS